MPYARYRVWLKRDDNNWVYARSLTDHFPFQVTVAQETYTTNGLNLTADYQAKFGRERLRFFNLSPPRVRVGQAREDARRFTYSHGSYDRLWELYADLVNYYKDDSETFFVPARRVDEDLLFRQTGDLLDLRESNGYGSEPNGNGRFRIREKPGVRTGER